VCKCVYVCLSDLNVESANERAPGEFIVAKASSKGPEGFVLKRGVFEFEPVTTRASYYSKADTGFSRCLCANKQVLFRVHIVHFLCFELLEKLGARVLVLMTSEDKRALSAALVVHAVARLVDLVTHLEHVHVLVESTNTPT
jgi:hypothetical protein